MVKLELVFEVDMGCNILPNLATVGTFDGVNQSIAVGSMGGTVVMHSLDTNYSNYMPIPSCHKFNVQGSITRLHSYSPGQSEISRLLIATPTSLLAYNADLNRDDFHIDVDGITALTTGELKIGIPLIFVGTESTITGYNSTGKEVYWSVSSHVISSMAVIPSNKSGYLVVGTDDCYITVFDDTNAVARIVETDTPMHIVPIGTSDRFVYGLANGVVGVYSNQSKVWSITPKSCISSITACDINGDGVLEIIIGWSDGSFEVRLNHENRKDLIYKETLTSPVTAVLSFKQAKTGCNMFLICTENGRVFGYSAMDLNTDEDIENKYEVEVEGLLKELELIEMEMKEVDDQLKQFETKNNLSNSLNTNDNIAASIQLNELQKSVDLIVKLSSDTKMFKGIILHSTNLFEGANSWFIPVSKPTQSLVVPLYPRVGVQTDIDVDILFGDVYSTMSEITKVNIKIPAFICYQSIPAPNVTFSERVTASLGYRGPQLKEWVHRNFTNHHHIDTYDKFEVFYTSLYDKANLSISFSTCNGGELTISSDCLGIVSQIIQHLITELNIDDLESTVELSGTLGLIKDMLVQLNENEVLRLKMTADIADATQYLKALLVRAEDARALSQIQLMKQYYVSIHDINKTLTTEHIKRCNNYKEFMRLQKEMHHTLEMFLNCRNGQPQSNLLTQIKRMLNDKSYDSLITLLSSGSSISSKTSGRC